MAENIVRQTVSLPAELARRVKEIAKSRRTSTSRVLHDLIEAGMEAEEREKQRLFVLADELVAARSPRERRRLKEELARLVFGE